MQNITVIEYRTLNIGKIQRKLSLIAKWTLMQENKDIVRNSVLVNSREIDNMTFMQSVIVIECRTAIYQEIERKHINQCQLDNHAKYHSH